MSNRPIKRDKKVVKITQDDFDVEWTPPPRTARDRLIQFGVVFLIICFLLPAITCAVTPEQQVGDPAELAQQQDELEMSIKSYSEQLAEKPNDPAVLANLGYYTTQKALRIPPGGDQDTQRMTLLATSEKYLRDALAQDSDYAFAQTELAKNLMVQEKTQEAEDLIAEALKGVETQLASTEEKDVNEAKSRKVELLRLSASADAQKGNMDQSLAKINEVIDIKPGDPENYLIRADLLNLTGKKDEALKDLETVVDIGSKTGNQQMVMYGQMMIEKLNSPPELDVISVEESVVTPTPTP